MVIEGNLNNDEQQEDLFYKGRIIFNMSVSKLGWIEDVETRLKHLLMTFPNINNIN